jgi:hypothetical protein
LHFLGLPVERTLAGTGGDAPEHLQAGLSNEIDSLLGERR